MNEKTKSPFFAAVADALDNAMQLRTKDDSILMVMADGGNASHLVGGNMQVLSSVLLNHMEQNPRVAEMVLSAAIDYQMHMAQKIRVVRVPPVPADGVAAAAEHIAPWPLIPSPRYQTGVDAASTDENKSES